MTDPVPLRRRTFPYVLPAGIDCDNRPWHTTVSSRLGRDLVARHAAFYALSRFTENAAKRGDGEWIVADTAASRWCRRACELFHIEPLVIDFDDFVEPINSGATVCYPKDYCRDRLAIEMADRVDVAYVRSGGTVMRLLLERLARDPAPTVQVLITQPNDKATRTLLDAGAIGFWVNTKAAVVHDDAAPPIRLNDVDVVASLLKNPDRWLVHSTRQRSGPWPGQSVQIFEDSLLLSPPRDARPSPLETLNRIIEQRRLIGTHQTTSTDRSVVSFTSLTIVDWLSRRTFRSHLSRWDAEPYGIAIDRAAASRLGIGPVIYGDSETLSRLPELDRWRFQAVGKTYDWTAEFEWRSEVALDLSRFETNEVVVFIRRESEVGQVRNSPWSIVTVDRLV